jgi:hypothetical protein
MCASRIRAESERKIAEMEHKLSESERKIIDYEIETARLYKSRSWMITKPLRSMAQILRAL